MHSQVVGIIELDEGANASSLTPRLASSLDSSAQTPPVFPSAHGTRHAAAGGNFVLVVAANTELLQRQLLDEYRQLLLHWIDQELES